jgi:alcohol dehydrogenase
MLSPLEFHARTRVVFGPGVRARVGELATDVGGRCALLVADRGIVAAGYASSITSHLERAGLSTIGFHDFGENPDSEMVARGRDIAAAHAVDCIVAVGGGSSLDCAKGINFLVTKREARRSRTR